MSFVGSMDSASVSQLLIDKSCNIDFDFPEGVCDDLLSDNNTASNDLVSEEVAQFKVIIFKLAFNKSSDCFP